MRNEESGREKDWDRGKRKGEERAGYEKRERYHLHHHHHYHLEEIRTMLMRFFSPLYEGGK